MGLRGIIQVLKSNLIKDYDKWTISWEKNEEYIKHMQEEYKFIDPSYIGICLVKNKSKVLSAGCGSGREVRFLVREKECKVTAIDHSKLMVESSKKVEPNATYVVADVTKFKSKGKFDFIVCLYNTINYFKGIEARKNFIKSSYDNLKEGGFLILITENCFSRLGTLMRNILTNKDFYYFPSQVDKWFENTNFKIYKTKVSTSSLIIAKK